MNGSTSKPCSKCGVLKPLSEFYRNSRSPGGYRPDCKHCQNKVGIVWRSRNREIIRAKQKQNYYKDVEKTRKKQNEYSKRNRIKNYIKRMLIVAKNRALKKGQEFTITAADISIPEYCPVLKIPIRVAEGKANGNSPSLDRRDNTKGYVPGNVFVISNRANVLKSDGTIEEFNSIIKYMTNHG